MSRRDRNFLAFLFGLTTGILVSISVYLAYETAGSSSNFETRILSDSALLSNADPGGSEKAIIKNIALDAIREHPEIIREAFQLLQAKELEEQAVKRKALLAIHRETLESGNNSYVLGNPQGDVTVVEFFDYQCPFCKHAVEVISDLIEQDPQVRVVFREFPILGEGSILAAQASLAARNQGKYLQLHRALMKQRHIYEDSVFAVARDLGLDTEKLRHEMQDSDVSDHIELSIELSELLNIEGTPAFIIGDQIVTGLLSLDQMLAHVQKSRSTN